MALVFAQIARHEPAVALPGIAVYCSGTVT